MVKMQGFEFGPLAQVVPVTFQPEKVQPVAGVAVTFTPCPICSEHPDGHDGAIVPSPTTIVVNVEHVPGLQVMVTMRGGASLVNPCTDPLTETEYCEPGKGASALTTSVVTNDGNPDDCANDVDNCPSPGETADVKLTFCGEPETSDTVT
jgi:hypothetical protein